MLSHLVLLYYLCAGVPGAVVILRVLFLSDGGFR